MANMDANLLITHLEIHRQVRSKDAFLQLRVRGVRCAEVRNGFRRLSVIGKREASEVLQQADEEEGHLIVRELEDEDGVSLEIP